MRVIVLSVAMARRGWWQAGASSFCINEPSSEQDMTTVAAIGKSDLGEIEGVPRKEILRGGLALLLHSSNVAIFNLTSMTKYS